MPPLFWVGDPLDKHGLWGTVLTGSASMVSGSMVPVPPLYAFASGVVTPSAPTGPGVVSPGVFNNSVTTGLAKKTYYGTVLSTPVPLCNSG